MPADYSAIVFVGGWGSSMYQYAFPATIANNRYDGNAATKAIVNDLIGDFLAQDKYVTAICHGVTVLAWARVDGASPLDGKTVSVPWIGSPAVFYEGVMVRLLRAHAVSAGHRQRGDRQHRQRAVRQPEHGRRRRGRRWADHHGRKLRRRPAVRQR